MGSSRRMVRGDREDPAGTYQFQDGPEQRAEREVQEVEAGGSVEVGAAHQLAGEEGLAGAAAEQAAHGTIAQVQLPGDPLARGSTMNEDPSPP